MCLYFVKTEHELTKTLQSPVAEANLMIIHSQIPPNLAEKMSTWTDARQWLDRIGAHAEEADLLLRPILKELQADRDENWNSIVLHLFMSPLTMMVRRFASLDDLSPLFSQIHWDFMKVVNCLDLGQRTARVGQKILNDTQHHTRAHYRRIRNSRELLIDETELEFFSQVTNGVPPLAETNFKIDRGWTIARLRSLTQTGQLSHADFQILLGCHLYDRSIEEMATKLGIRYESAKKRRIRATKKLEKISPDMSPDSADSPLYPLRRSSRKEVDHVR